MPEGELAQSIEGLEHLQWNIVSDESQVALSKSTVEVSSKKEKENLYNNCLV